MRVLNPIFALPCLGLIGSTNVHASSTYQLSFDGVVHPNVMKKYAVTTIPEQIADELSSDFQGLFVSLNDSSSHNDEGEVRCSLSTHNFDSGHGNVIGATRRCSTTSHGARSGISFTIDSSVYSIEDDTSTLSNIYPDVEENAGRFFGVSVDITLNASPDHLARDTLVQSLPKMNRVLGISVDDKDQEAIWTINKRVSPVTQRKMKGSLPSSSQEASMERIILSNTDLISRKHLIPSTDELRERIVSTEVDAEPPIDIWEYEIPGQKDTTRSLFIDSQLRATTDPAAIAHAESFVHPALLAHEHPSRIAVISDSPLSIVKEIWKHKTVDKIDVIGAHVGAFAAINTYMPDLNDCSSVNPFLQECMNEQEEMFNGTASEWITFMNSKSEWEKYDENWDGFAPYPMFDVILLDIASDKQADEYLSEKFQFALFDLVNEHSIVVVNTGSLPSIRVDHTRFEENPKRTSYLDFISRSNLVDGVHVYDEPLAAPLDTSFIYLFMETTNTPYFRYVRKQPAAIDLDIAQRLHKQKSMSTPTRFYDGPTHVNQLKSSRAWENWYCQSDYSKDRSDCQFVSTFYDSDSHQGVTEVKRDALKGRGLYAATSFKKGHFVNADDIHLSIHIDRYQWDALNQFIKDYPDAHKYRELKEFFDSYGFENEGLGNSGWSVSLANTNTFTNHACSKNVTTVGLVDYYRDSKNHYVTFSPLIFRRSEYGMVTVAARDVEAGEEILMDYSPFRSQLNDDFKNFLQKVCDTGEGLVPVEVQKGASDEL